MSKRKEARVQRLSRGQVSRREQEEKKRRFILSGVGALLVLAAIVLALGIYQEKVAKPARPVARVQGRAITLKEYEERLRYGRFWLGLRRAELQQAKAELPSGAEAEEWALVVQQRLEELELEETSLPQELVETMIDDLLIQQAVGQEGLSVPSAQEVEAQLLGLFGWGQSGQEQATSTLTDTASSTPQVSQEEARTMLAAFLRQFTSETGLSEEYLKTQIGIELLRRMLYEKIALTVPLVAEEVQVRHILVESQEAAQQVLDRLSGGEDFAALAAELSLDTTSAPNGGDLGWFPRGVMLPSFEEAAFSTPVGATSGAVETAYGYHILQVLGKEERALDENTLAILKETAFYKWLQAKRAAVEIETFPLPSQPTLQPNLGKG